jgi:HD-GYP domain-containing protein (c-di-GMP phosphodiesterase class II)
MTSRRPYRRRFTTEEAAQELAAYAGTQFDPILVAVFVDALKQSDTVDLSDVTVAAVKTKIDEVKNGLLPALD